ncbi:hypothetical protein N431DRAFT_462414 [Stipitochalara longipes BDJ]|nr:hypothetical protein N431DRAFT_462414 [Stipitochalara longipes BDJ]
MNLSLLTLGASFAAAMPLADLANPSPLQPRASDGVETCSEVGDYCGMLDGINFRCYKGGYCPFETCLPNEA